MPKKLITVDSVLDALGGTSAVAKLTQRRASAVSNWRSVGTIPPKLYWKIMRPLEMIGLSASPKVFGMSEFKMPPTKYLAGVETDTTTS